MKLIYREQISQKSVAKETSDRAFDFPVTIGRGGTSNLILNIAGLAVEHAKLSCQDGQVYITALAPSHPIYLGGIPVGNREKLESGANIKIGELELTIGVEAGNFLLVHNIQVEALEKSGNDLEAELFNLSIESKLPSIRLLSFILVLLSIITTAIWPLLDSKGSLSSGPISNSHHMISGDCKSCHQGAFERVADSACLNCHNLSKHAEEVSATLATHPAAGLRCGDCHFEHRAGKLLAHDSRQCSTCHADLKNYHFKAQLADIPNLRMHADFRIPKEDSAHIKLNHEKHLAANLKGPEGPTQLACGDCHGLSKDFKTITPISFDNNCRSCHSLEFDERLPGNQVPHAQPDLVYNYMYAEYAKLFLSNQVANSPEATRARPGEEAAPKAEVRPSFVRAAVEVDTREAESLLFTKTGCYLCHDVSKREDTSSLIARFEILKPEIPTRWMPKSIFSHGAHEEVKCESCHNGARASKATTDVLMPKIDDCRACHADQKAAGKVGSDCTMCHSYHDSRGLAAEKKRELSTILSLVAK